MPVNVVRAEARPRYVEITLPGTLRPWQEVSIFARTTGYLKKYYVDISNDVEEGQLHGRDRHARGRPGAAPGRGALLQTKAAVTKADRRPRPAPR